MTSAYIEQSARAVEANRDFTRRKIENVLDQLWLAVDIVGFDGPQSADYEAGFEDCQRQICAAIESLGGTYPPARKAIRIAAIPIKEAAE